ncbi:MAG: GNAT family N-acetyltransferase [Acidimicrobiales bacterium]|jgi:GNAT superfamily N-acetyltransferase
MADGGVAPVEAARTAQPADAEQCAQLCSKALDSLQGQRGGALFARRDAGLLAKALLRPGGLSRLLSDPRRRVLVGTVDDVVVGLAVGRVDPVGEASVGVMDAVYVDPGCRGKGVGHALLHALVGWFEESGCRAVDAAVLPGDRETKNFFEGAGFKARLITMHRPLR